MSLSKNSKSKHAFTLVELLVVIAIIALLVGILVPAIGAVRTSAKNTKTNAQIKSLDTGLERFRAEQSLGGIYPPSSGDGETRHQIHDPAQDATAIDIAGTHLLVQAMIGADLLGPPGFVDLNRDGEWWNDTGNGQNALYYVDPNTGEPSQRRYENAFVDDTMRGNVRTLNQLFAAGKTINNLADENTIGTMNQYMFVDAFDQPILYYRANKAARFMTGDASGGNAAPPIYRQEDNAIITGSNSSVMREGADFGTSVLDGKSYVHPLALPTTQPALTVELDGDSGLNEILVDEIYQDTMTRFILDPNSRGRNQPVRKDSYLLISAGADALYGTEDDVTNWQRTSP